MGIGIYIGNMAGHPSGGSYWTRPRAVFALINDNEPTKVNINFDIDISSVLPDKSCFTIAGKTITSVSVSGRLISLTVSDAFVYGDTPSASYLKPVTNLLKSIYNFNSASFTVDVINNIYVEMVDQDAWNNAGYAFWTESMPANWTGNGTKLVSDGNTGYLGKKTFWTIGETYKVKYSCTVNSGMVICPFDGSAGGFSVTVSETREYYIVPTSGFLYLYSSSFNGTIDALSVKHVIKAFDKGRMVVTFDDATDSQYSNALPLFKSKSVAFTPYIPTDLVGTATKMTWGNLLELHQNKMDDQCHSQLHIEERGLSEAQIDTQMLNVNNAFIANGLPSPEHHAYPFGLSDANLVSYISQWRKTCRNAGGEPVGKRENWRNTDKYQLHLVYVSLDNLDATGLVATKAAMDQALIDKTTIIFGSHGVTLTSATYSISIDYMGQILDYARFIGLDVITISDLHNLMMPKLFNY